MKRCTRCHKEKVLEKFSRDCTRPDGRFPWCFVCKRLSRNSQADAAAYAKWYQKNQVRKRLQNKEWRGKNRPAGCGFSREYRAGSINGRLAHVLRERTRRALNGQPKAGSVVRDLGCSITELRSHLESKFQPGMSWDNYGQWHIDHIKPLAKFDLTNRVQFLESCHYTNLQPLWAEENLKKGARY